MKEKLGQECEKEGVYPSMTKIETISPDIPGKILVFLVLPLLVHPSLLKIWLSHLHKNLYI